MAIVNDTNWQCFLDCVGDLLSAPEVQSMKRLPHHPGVNCYEHSVFVAYMAFRLARRYSLDYKAAARCGLLHDLYLYDPRDRSAHPGGLSAKERNIIVSHMWPLAIRMPHSREAAVVNVADKFCATAELVGYWRRSRVRRMALA